LGGLGIGDLPIPGRGEVYGLPVAIGIVKKRPSEAIKDDIIIKFN
jgi:hypothetical protein